MKSSKWFGLAAMAVIAVGYNHGVPALENVIIATPFMAAWCAFMINGK
jgi:hypothetical protein